MHISSREVITIQGTHKLSTTVVVTPGTTRLSVNLIQCVIEFLWTIICKFLIYTRLHHITINVVVTVVVKVFACDFIRCL